MPVPPDMSLKQRREALGRANVVRCGRAELKRQLKHGEVSIDSQLRHPPDMLATMKVSDLLLAVPKYGRVKVNKILQTCRVSPSKTVGGLTVRQRSDLLAEIRRRDVAMDETRLQKRALVAPRQPWDPAPRETPLQHAA